MNPICPQCTTEAYRSQQPKAAYCLDEKKTSSVVQQGYAVAVCHDQMHTNETALGEGENIGPIQPQIATPPAPGTSVFSQNRTF